MKKNNIIKIDSESMLPIADDPISLIHNTINSLSNLFYELVMAININNLHVEYFAITTGLAKLLSQSNIDTSTFASITQCISGISPIQLEEYLTRIKEYYRQIPDEEKPYTSFMIDFPYLLNEGKNWATYNFAPLSEDKEGNLMFFVVSVSYSTGCLKNKIMASNNKNQQKKIYDFSQRLWLKYETPKLTAIEKSVLALSAQGLSVNEIADILSKAVDSIKSVRKRIFQKLEVENIIKAIVFAINNKII